MRVLLALAALPLAGCQNQAAPAPKPSPTESGYIAKVQALSPGQREGVLLRAIIKGGGPGCQGIKTVKSEPATKAGQPDWLVTCDEGSQWEVVLSDDGTALVTGARNPNGAG